MPNRIIKESIRMSDTLSKVSADAERLFWRLVVSADDYGRFDGRANIIIGQCMSSFYGEITIDQVENWLIELQNVELLKIYIVDNKRYLMLTNWSKHQRVRAKDSKFPAIEDGRIHVLTNDSGCCQTTTSGASIVNEFENVNEYVNENEYGANDETTLKRFDNVTCNNIETPHITETEKEKDKKNMGAYTPEFEKFWSVYPRKKEKAGAFKVWKARLKDGVESDMLIEAAKAYANECQQKGTEEQYRKHPKTFLGPSKPYEDYLKVEQAPIDRPKVKAEPVENKYTESLRAVYANTRTADDW